MFVAVIIIVNFATALTMRLAGTPNKNVLLENTFAPHHLKEPEVLKIAAEYKKRLLQLAAGLSLFSLLMLIPKYEAFMMTLFWLNLFLSLSVYYICEILYIRKMHRLIIEKQWLLPVEPVLVDTQLIQIKNKKMVSWYWFIPSFLLILFGSILAIRNGELYSWPLLLTAGIVWLLFVISRYFIFRLPVRPVTSDRQINQQYNDLTKYYWSLLSAAGSYIIIPMIFLPLFSLDISGTAGKLWITGLLFLLLAIAFGSIWFLLQLRKKQDRLINQASDYRYMGEDHYWRYGVYINPDDTRIFLPDRIGMNLTVNLGRRVGQVITGAIGVLLLGVVIVTLLISYLYDFTADPFQFTVKEDQVELKAPLAATSIISKDAIEKVQLIDKIDGSIVRTNGYGSENYSVGHFQVDGKRANFYVSNDSKPILHIQTKNQDYYYTNKNPELTKKAYEELK